MSLKKTKIAIAGVGTVGSGVLDLFNKNSVHKKFGIELTAVASRRKIDHKKLCFKNFSKFNDAKKLLEFNDYDILVELIGGDSGIAKEIVFDALRKGKNVVTANKALVSKHWLQIDKILSKKKIK